MVLYGIVWYGMVWYGMVWYCIVLYLQHWGVYPLKILIQYKRNTIFAVTREARVKGFEFFSLYCAKTGKACVFELLYNLKHALADNVDRVSPGPFFSGL